MHNPVTDRLLSPSLPRDIWRQLQDVRLLGITAEIAFYQLLGFFPLLLLCVFLLGLFPHGNLVVLARRLFAELSPEMVSMLVDAWLARAYSLADYTILSFSGLGIIWAGSAGVGALIEAFTIINGRQEEMGIIRTAVYRVIFTVVGGIGLVIALVVWVVAPALVAQFFSAAGLDTLWRWAWFFIRWPLGFLFFVLVLTTIYSSFSIRRRPFHRSIPGATIACLLFAGSSHLFSLYIGNLATLSVTFGTISVIIVLMLWLQLLDLAILIGEIFNFQLYRSRLRRPGTAAAAPAQPPR